MIDELELAFDERPEKGRHRRGARRKQKQRQRGGRGRTLVALLTTFVLLGGLAGGVWYGFDRIQGLFSAPDYSGGGAGEVMIEVKPGETATEIGNTLVIAGVVKSSQAFIDAAREDVRSQNIQPGFYRLRKQMSAEVALGLLLDLKNKVSNKITIPEGRTAKQTYLLLEKATRIPAKEFEAAAKDPIGLGVPDWWFKRTDGRKVTRSIEGFLFPDTYDFDPNMSAQLILETMVQNFLTVTGDIKFVDRVEAERGGISPYEALMVASLAQAEAGHPDDLPKVARVAYNRVYKANMPLEFDVTVNYYWELTGKPTKASKDMKTAELRDPRNPYSTHAHTGLPPTPINNPGKAGLEGALNPPDKGWLFFVAIDKQGHSAFAVTNAEHERNIETAKENGVL